MKQLFTLLLTITSVHVFSQNSNAVFFTENGEKFTVILNGLKYNKTPETNVKVSALQATPYTLKIIFDQANLSVLDDKVWMEPYKEKTYSIKLKSVSQAEKSSKKLGENLSVNFLDKDSAKAEEKRKEIDKTDKRYVIKLQSVTILPGGDEPAATTTNTNTSGNTNSGNTTAVSSGGSKGNTSTQTQTTNTSVTTGVAGGSTTDNVNMNVNVSVSGTETHTSSTTITSTSTESGHYEMAGYNGPMGCPWPMSPGDFESAKKSIESKSFEDSKLTIAKQIINSNCLLCTQVKDIMLLFSFENTRLDLAKYSWKKTFDQGNYYKLNDAFTFESSIDELNEYIQKK